MEQKNEEDLTPSPVKTKTFSSELIVALAAIFVGVATLFVYIYQARIMQHQQYASVWPYIEWVTYSSDTEGFFIQVENKGVGPAIIKSVKMKLNGKQLNDNQELFKAMIGIDDFDYDQSTVEGRVIAAREIIKPFFIPDSVIANKFNAAWKKNKFSLEICYCSIYGECWTSYGVKVVESKCD
jgi:hypothetical protein